MMLDVRYKTNSEKACLRYQEVCCGTCRYFRVDTRSSADSECILLGRTLGIASKGESHLVLGWANERYCDFWKRRPRKWQVYAEANPHWNDMYIKRETLIRLRKRRGLT